MSEYNNNAAYGDGYSATPYSKYGGGGGHYGKQNSIGGSSY